MTESISYAFMLESRQVWQLTAQALNADFVQKII
jgi:hypothetical protein